MLCRVSPSAVETLAVLRKRAEERSLTFRLISITAPPHVDVDTTDSCMSSLRAPSGNAILADAFDRHNLLPRWFSKLLWYLNPPTPGYSPRS